MIHYLQTHISQPSGSGADEGTGSKPRVPDVPTDESEEELSWSSTDDEGDDNEEKDDDGDEKDEGDDGQEGNGDDDDEDDDGEAGDDDDADQEVVRDDDKGDDEEGGDDEHESDEDESDEETRDEETFDHILQTPKDSEDKGDGKEDLSLNIGEEERHVEKEEEDELYRDININQGRGIQANLEVKDSHVTLTLVNLDGMESIFETTSQLDVQTPTSVAPLPMTAPTLTPFTIATITTTSQALILPPTFARAVSAIPGIINQYIDQRMNEAVKLAVQIQSDCLCDEAQRENEEFLKTVDENMQTIIKEQSIQRSDEQRNLYNALFDAYESNKIILDTYGETVTLKRRRDDDADKDEKPSAGPNRGSKRRIEGKEPESASALMETATRSAGSTEDQPFEQSSQHPEWFSQQQKPPSPDRAWNKTVDTLTPELLAGPTYELIKGPCKSLVELEYHLEEVFKATIDQLDWVNPEGQQYPHNLLQPLPLIPNNRGRRVIPFEHFINNDLEYLRGGYDKHALWGVSHWGCKRQQFYGFAVNRESARDVYSKRRIIPVTELKIVEQAFNVSLRMFTRSIMIQRRVEDLQLGVESYQKKLNLTKPNSYRSDLKREEAYTAYSNPRGFIYQNKDKRNRLMQIDKLHKFSDGTLTDVRTALDDRLKGIRMQYLPQSI
uniref:Uncharacterized protein n=1 Tax=Tanacetum cinerariifolium TaxID=118510 RepID=A0A6L2NRZ8_TANCI|nr:hypothetical protein [Tanacetum cinerariifolium]